MVGDALAQELVDLGDGADANEDDLLADGLRLRQQLVEQIEVAEIADVVDHDRDEIDGLGGEALRQKVDAEAEALRRGQHAFTLLV